MNNRNVGFIEGFYGKRYTEEEHEFLFSFMKNHGFGFFIYAPKEDRQLRDEWDKAPSAEYLNYIKDLSDSCHAAGLEFGIALSPLNLTCGFDLMKEKVRAAASLLCNTCRCEIFCLLFDDMDKASEDTGAKQCAVICDIEKILPSFVRRFIVCPSYYTDDPVLDRIFGKRPEKYFEELCGNLPERAEIFWTGPKVVSEDISAEHLQKVGSLLGRKAFIWDNYPVNDGIKLHNFLFLRAFNGRRGIQGMFTGYAVNPMVQCRLSTLPAVTLPLILAGAEEEKIRKCYEEYAAELFGKAADRIISEESLHLLTEVGNSDMSAEQKASLLEICDLDDTPALEEIREFLHGSKRFDEAIINRTHKLFDELKKD